MIGGVIAILAGIILFIGHSIYIQIQVVRRIFRILNLDAIEIVKIGHTNESGIYDYVQAKAFEYRRLVIWRAKRILADNDMMLLFDKYTKLGADGFRSALADMETAMSNKSWAYFNSWEYNLPASMPNHEYEEKWLEFVADWCGLCLVSNEFYMRSKRRRVSSSEKK